MSDDTPHRSAAVYFVHQKTGARFKVIGRDVDAGTITLEGEYGTFTEKYDKQLFIKNGYVLEKQ